MVFVSGEKEYIEQSNFLDKYENYFSGCRTGNSYKESSHDKLIVTGLGMLFKI